jgi:hypothetical protein
VILDRSMSLAQLIAGPISVRSLGRRLGERRSCGGQGRGELPMNVVAAMSVSARTSHAFEEK